MFSFKSTRVLRDGHNVPLIGVYWGWEALAMAGCKGFAGSLPLAPLTSGAANWDWNLGFHCLVGKNLTQTEKVGSDYSDEQL